MRKTCGGLLAVFLLLSLAATAAPQEEQPPAEHPIDKALGKCVDQDPSTAGMSDCISQAYVAWDKELNKNYNRLLAKLKPKERLALKAAQAEWIKYRNAEFNLIDAIYETKEGTMYISMRAEDRLRVVKKRALELASYLDFYENG